MVDIDEARFKKGYTELNYIINNMEQSLREKIPDEFIKIVKSKMDLNYKPNIDISESYINQKYMPETKALLSILFSDYIGDEKMKEKWREFDMTYKNVNRQIRNSENQDNNSIDVFNKVRKEQNNVNSNSMIVVKKESFFHSILKKIKAFFGRQ